MQTHWNHWPAHLHMPGLKLAHNSYDFYVNETIAFPENDTYDIRCRWESFKQAKVLNTADTVKYHLCAWEIMFNVT